MLFLITFSNTSFIAELILPTWDDAIAFAKKRAGKGEYTIHLLREGLPLPIRNDEEVEF